MASALWKRSNLPTSFNIDDAPDITIPDANFKYAVYVTDEVKLRKGSSLRLATDATLTLISNDGETPATIYADKDRTVVNTTGTVVTNENGVWTAFLDPAEGPVTPVYKGASFKPIPVSAEAYEADYDIAKFASDHGINTGEVVASRDWVEERLGQGGIGGGITTDQVQAIVNAAISAITPGDPGAVVDVTPFARIRGDEGLRDIVISDVLPTNVYEATPQVTADGRFYLQRKTISQAPTTPVTTPEAVDTITTLSHAHTHLDVAYIDSVGKMAGTPIPVRAVARALEESAVQGDQVTFDLVWKWAEANFKRTAQATAKDLYGAFYDATNNTLATPTVDSGAMLTVFGSLVRAWNLWGVAAYHECASKIFSDLVNYCVIEDEGRAYLCVDDNQKAVGGGRGHHVNPGDGGYMSAHELGAVNPVFFRAAKTFTGAAICDRLLLGYYDLVNKMVAQNASGLVADYVAYNTATHGISPITNGTNGWISTQSNNFGLSAQNVGRDLLMDKRAFGAVEGTTALSKLRQHYAAAWAANARIVDTYGRDGAEATTTQSSAVAIIAMLILRDGDAADATAAAIKANKIVTTLPTDANGAYFPNQVKGVTAVSDRDNDLRAWLALSRDQDRYIDIVKLGSNPSVGVVYPPGNNGGGTSTPVVVTPDPNTPPPTVGTVKLYADTQSQAALYYAANSGGWSAAKKAGYVYGISRASGMWISSGWGDAGLDYLRQYLRRCKDAGAAATILTYDMPLRDVSGGYSAGGQATAASYKTWISTKVVPVCNEFPTVTKYFNCEPDSAAAMNGLSADAAALRADLLKWNGAYLKSNLVGTKKIYLDAGHPRWHPASEIAPVLVRCGIENYDGFACNTSNTWSFNLNVEWAQAIRAIIGTKYRFTIDCGRNGAADGGTDQWANPPNRVAGKFPQAGNLGVDGLDLVVDWKRVGESDGNSGDGAPNAGGLWPQYLWNDAITQPGYNVNSGLVSTSSGVWQRWPAGLAPATNSSGNQSGV